jgi:hypothetical protein
MSEIDALKELSELKASLSYEFWDNAAYVALVAVFIGVVGEFLVELTSWPADAVWRAKLGKASVLILIAGLGGDIVTYAKNSAINGTIIGFLHKKAGDAFLVAGEANERAAKADERAYDAFKIGSAAQVVGGAARVSRPTRAFVVWTRTSSALHGFGEWPTGKMCALMRPSENYGGGHVINPLSIFTRDCSGRDRGNPCRSACPAY